MSNPAGRAMTEVTHAARQAARSYGRRDRRSAASTGDGRVRRGGGDRRAGGRRTGRRPAPLSPFELTCMSLATHKVSRIVARMTP